MVKITMIDIKLNRAPEKTAKKVGGVFLNTSNIGLVEITKERHETDSKAGIKQDKRWGVSFSSLRIVNKLNLNGAEVITC